MTLVRPLAVFVDLLVVKANPRGLAQELIASSKDSRESYVFSGGSSFSANVALDILVTVLRLIVRLIERAD